MNATVRGEAEAIYFALAKTNNTQIKLKEEQKEDIRQIVNARDVKSLIYQLLPSMFDYIKGIQQYIFLLFHLEELLKLYVNLFYRFCVTLLFLEIFEQKKSQIS